MPKHIRNREETRQRLIQAVSEVLAEKGFSGLGINPVARQAGVDKVLIYRYFGGMPGLIKAFGQEGDYWPTIEELAGGNIESFRLLSFEDRLEALGLNYLAGIRKRPLTLEIMAWEMVEQNDLTRELETIRHTRLQRFFELFLPLEGVESDLMAIISIVGAGFSYLACRARSVQHFNGIDLANEEGWERIEDGFRHMINGIITQR